MTDAHDPSAIAVQTVTERPELTIIQAADAAGLNARTIRRHLDQFPNAHRGEGAGSTTGPWLIPATDLEAAGYSLNAPNPKSSEPVRPELLDVLQAERDEWRRRAEVAEAIATERASSLADLRAALDLVQRAVSVNSSSAAAPTPAGPSERH